MTTLTVSSEACESWTVLRAVGEIDLVSGGRIRAEAHRLVAEGQRRIVIDLGGVRFCDSSGIGVLIGARRLLRSCGGELRLVLPPASPGAVPAQAGHVHRVFTALGLRRLFDIHPDVAAATAAPVPRPLARPA